VHSTGSKINDLGRPGTATSSNFLGIVLDFADLGDRNG